MLRTTGAWSALLLGGVLLLGGRAAAEWVRGEVHLNLRTGPGTDHRIVASIATGDEVTVIEPGEEWVRVRIADGRDGWIPGGFLADAPPAVVRLDQSEAAIVDMRERLDRVTAEAEKLRSSNDELTKRTESLASDNERLDMENRQYRAGGRWPEWITGASILAVGMLLGAIVHSLVRQRSQSRIRI